MDLGGRRPRHLWRGQWLMAGDTARGASRQPSTSSAELCFQRDAEAPATAERVVFRLAAEEVGQSGHGSIVSIPRIR
jgi:hypothetical protein